MISSLYLTAHHFQHIRIESFYTMLYILPTHKTELVIKCNQIPLFTELNSISHSFSHPHAFCFQYKFRIVLKRGISINLVYYVVDTL